MICLVSFLCDNRGICLLFVQLHNSYWTNKIKCVTCLLAKSNMRLREPFRFWVCSNKLIMHLLMLSKGWLPLDNLKHFFCNRDCNIFFVIFTFFNIRTLKISFCSTYLEPWHHLITMYVSQRCILLTLVFVNSGKLCFL